MIGAIEIMFIPAGFTLDSMIFISWRIQDALHILSVTNYNILTQLRAFLMLIGIHYILIKAKLRFEWKPVFFQVFILIDGQYHDSCFLQLPQYKFHFLLKTFFLDIFVEDIFLFISFKCFSQVISKSYIILREHVHCAVCTAY